MIGQHALRNPSLIESVTGQLAIGTPIQDIARNFQLANESVIAVRDTVGLNHSVTRSFRDSQIKAIESVTPRMLGKYSEALEANMVRPESIPLGYAILLTKRDELRAEAGGPAPVPTLTPAQLLAELDEVVPVTHALKESGVTIDP